MPRPRKPTRLIYENDTESWRIFKADGTRIRLPIRGKAGREAAEAALADELIAERLGSSAPQRSESLQVMDAVYRYAEARAEHVAKPQLLADAIEALSPYWSGKNVAEITRKTCEDYARWRCGGGLRRHQLKTRGESGSKAEISPSTARRDLTTLRAALKFAQADGILIGAAPVVVLPAETPARDRVMTRDECAAVLRELWRGAPTRARDGSTHRSPGKTRHAARLFWLMLYTGSRADTVYQSTRKKRKDGPWVDLVHGLWHRRGSAERETNKRRDAHRIPGRIALALERWERLFPDQTYLVEVRSRPGLPIGDIGQALDGACKRLGIERITPHTIKHTAISLFVSGGGDPAHAAEYFSTSLQTILDNHLHLSPGYQDGAMGHIGRLGKRDSLGRYGTKPQKLGENQRKHSTINH